MGFTLEQSTRLLTLIVFVFWEMYNSCSDEAQEQYMKDAKKFKIRRVIPASAFMPIWLFLKSLIVASFFLYMEYTTSTDNLRIYLTVFVLFASNVLAAKFWMPLFFKWQMRGTALLLAFFLMGSAWAVFGLMVSRQNLIAVGASQAPAWLWFAYPLWLTGAFFINAHWVYKERKHHWKTLPREPSAPTPGVVTLMMPQWFYNMRPAKGGYAV